MKSRIVSIAAFADANVAAPFDPAVNPSKAAAYWLRRDVVRGVFEPMDRLKVEPLVRFYNVGHSPIREAILLLSSSGLVIHEHQKGYRVAPVSLADYDDTVSVYQRLYKLALVMAMELGDEAWEERVVVHLHRSSKTRKTVPDNDPQAHEHRQRAYWEFHAALLSGSDSPLLMQLIGDIGSRLERYVNLFAGPGQDEAREDEAEYREIVDAVVARDRDRALGLIDRHFAAAQPMRESIIDALKRSETGKVRRGRPSAVAKLERGATGRRKSG